jgi:tRNA(Ile)-lysidine synthase
MSADPLLDSLRAFVRLHGLLQEGQRVLVGVSGGVDSLVLLHLLNEDFRPIAVHVDHGLREDSHLDAEFVQRVAAEWDIEFRVEKIEVPAGSSKQARARRERYRALESAADEEGVGVVAVAHNRDDVAETLLLQLVRGAGPRGWRAMPVERPIRSGSAVYLVRPLRFAARNEIEAYAHAHGIDWREDPSNEVLAYRRAVVRKRVLPLLKKHFGEGVSGKIAAAAELAEAYLEAGAALAPNEALRRASPEAGALSVAALQRMDEVMRRGVILEVMAREFPDAPRSADGVVRVERLLDAQPGRRVELGEVVVWREREVLRIAHAHQSVHFAGNVSIPGRIDTPAGSLFVEVLGDVPSMYVSDPRTEVVDAERVGSALTLRTWREGDRFSPLGLGGSKKVSDVLTERRVPSSERQRQLVLTAGEEIVWVVGHRLAENFRIRSDTQRALRLRWEPEGGLQR